MSASAQKVVFQDEHEDDYEVHGDGQLRRKVLLIDEQAHVLRVLRLNLDRHGYEVDMAMCSESALRMVQENQYSVIIITSDLADMSAQQLCEFSEKKSQLQYPLLFVGASEDETWIDSLSFVNRLEKPVSLRWIVARLNEAFGESNP